jgi:hypothetical protein
LFVDRFAITASLLNPKSNFKTLSGQSPDRPKTLPRALRVTSRSFESPLHRLGFPKKSGEVGEDCLSAKREFRSRPIFSEIRGKPEGPVKRGALLFGYSSLGQARESNQPSGCPRQSINCAQRNKPPIKKPRLSQDRAF